jgi:hypothetical protein
MIPGLSLAVLVAFVLKVHSKNTERKCAEKISLTLARAHHGEMIEMLREMVPQLSASSVMVEMVFGTLFYVAAPLAMLLRLFSFSTVHVDARTVSPVVLWDSRYELLDLRDRDILDALGEWEHAVRRDIFMLILLLGSLLTLASALLEK